jgi:hypothetical protein
MLSLSGHSAANKLSFQGHISRREKLRPGTYTVVITATDAAGHARPVKLRFTIVR